MKKAIITFSGFVLLLLLIFSAYSAVKEDKKELVNPGDPVYTYFYRTKNDADCILIKQGGASILIDTGEKVDAKGIITFLKEQNIETINYMILTHADKDHIGGALDIIKNLKVEEVIKPYYSNKSDEMDLIESELLKREIRTSHQLHMRKFSAGEISIFVYPPLEKRYSDDNNYSLATLVTHKNVKMLFPGDAKYKRLNELLEIKWGDDIALLKIPYHGRQVENSKLFIETINPEFAVVTAADADESILQACDETGAQIFYTLKQDVGFISDGKTLNIMEG